MLSLHRQPVVERGMTHWHPMLQRDRVLGAAELDLSAMPHIGGFRIDIEIDDDVAGRCSVLLHVTQPSSASASPPAAAAAILRHELLEREALLALVLKRCAEDTAPGPSGADVYRLGSLRSDVSTILASVLKCCANDTAPRLSSGDDDRLSSLRSDASTTCSTSSATPTDQPHDAFKV